MATPAPEGGGNFLTRKLGPLPTWAWAGLAVGGFLYWRKRQAAAAAAAGTAATTTPATGLPTTNAQAPTGYGYQGPGVGGGGQGMIPQGATAVTAGASPAVPNTTAASGPSYSEQARWLQPRRMNQ